MNLFIIEGLGKKDAIKKYLGKDYEVFPTLGHVRDLPVKSLGIMVDKNFEPIYEINSDKKKVVDELLKLSKKAEKIYIATDPDREGEAIAYHIATILNMPENSKVRVAFNAIDKESIQNALKQPRELDVNLINAQQARRVLDRLVGYKISPIICKKIKPNLSAGRVQSVALKLVVDREKEIQNFVPEEYWTLNVEFENQGLKPVFKAPLTLKDGKKIKISNKDEMDKVLAELDGASYVVSSVKKSVTKSSAPAPFTTSTMQQDAGNKLNFSSKKTTQCAQQLYEGVEIAGEGKLPLVTYIRTDSVRVSEGAMFAARNFITEKFGVEYAPKKFNVYKSKADAQDAHEAIRPINLNVTPESLKEKISGDLYKLYKLIYNRFLASQMSAAEYNSVSANIDAKNYTFKATGKTPKFLGYTAVYVDTSKQDEVKLPKLAENDVLKALNKLPEQKFTKPEPRYTESSLIKAMEDKGIGRPATYSATLAILFNRKYCDKNAKQIVPTELGISVSEMLDKYFNRTINVNFTAQMEDELDNIAAGKTEWHDLVNRFYNKFLPQLKAAQDTKEVVVTDVICDKCGAKMVEREGRFGKFLACPNYPKCKNIKNLKPEVQSIETDIVCEKCGGKMLEKQGKYGKFLGCSNYPKCNNMKKIEETFEPRTCDKCGSEMVVKNGRYGKFYACSKYPECKNIMNIKNNIKTEPKPE